VSVETFANVSGLEVLDLCYNNLRRLDITILKEMPKLFELNLEWNEISEIIPDIFEKFGRLKYLILDRTLERAIFGSVDC
jgi:Leucine-rich repeat (LRR) protein